MLTPQESKGLIEQIDAIGNSYAAGEGAAAVSERIEAAKSAVAELTDEESPVQTAPSHQQEEPALDHEEESAPEHELETVQ